MAQEEKESPDVAALERLDELIEEFKQEYPGPYLDLSTRGLTLRILTDARERLYNLGV